MSNVNENFVIIWLDSNLNDSDENTRNEVVKLGDIVENVRTFNDADQCFNFLQDIKNEKIFIIISDSFEQYFVHFLNFMEDMDGVYSIYIVCNHQEKFEKCKKLKGVFTEIEYIFDILKQDINQCKIDLTSNTVDLNKRHQLDPSYVYSKILLEIISKIQYDDDAKNVLISYWREQWADNISYLRRIDEFERCYSEHSPVWWYTRESYIYLTLNRALRTSDFSVIIKMGFFIQDLRRQIENLHSQAQYTTKTMVYRGQGLLKIDFEKMKNGLGGLISFNNFLSTNLDREISLMFAESSMGNHDMVGVLFEIEIDPSVPSTPFALIDDVNCYGGSESEILFSVGSIFQIDKIEQIDGTLWKVNLISTNDIDPHSKDLINCLRNEIEDENALYSLALLMNKMGHFNEAQEIHTKLLETTSSFTNYNQIGLMYQSMGDYSKALCYYEQTLDYTQKSLPSDDPSLGTIYNNLAAVHQSLGDYSRSLSYYEKALEIKQKTLPSNHLSLSTTYNNLGDVYNSMGEYFKALSYYERALDIQQKSLPHIHPSFAITYNNIGLVHRSIGNYSIALLSYKKALNIELQALPSNHPSFSITYNNIGLLYSFLKKYPTALSYYEKALEIAQKTNERSSLALIYNNMGEVYDSLKDYSSALSYYEKALEIQQKYLPSNHPELAAVYNNIGEVYRSEGNYTKALEYYEKTLDIERNIFPVNHPSLAITYINISVTLEAEQRYEDAIRHTEQAVRIFQNIFGLNHSKTKEAQTYLDTLRQKL